MKIVCEARVSERKRSYSNVESNVGNTDTDNLVFEQAEAEVRPQFTGCTHKPGWMVFTYNDAKTAQCVTNIISRVKVGDIIMVL